MKKSFGYAACASVIIALSSTLAPVRAADPAPEAQAASDAILVTLDQATILKLDAPATAIVIGNPAIADAIVQDGKTLIVTGKGFGNTNLIGLDEEGNQLFERQLVVRVPEAGRVTVYAGVNRQTLSCAPKCQPTVTLGDGNESFNNAISQTQGRNSLSQSQSLGE